jgi:hypothetical protein
VEKTLRRIWTSKGVEGNIARTHKRWEIAQDPERNLPTITSVLRFDRNGDVIARSASELVAGKKHTTERTDSCDEDCTNHRHSDVCRQRRWRKRVAEENRWKQNLRAANLAAEQSLKTSEPTQDSANRHPCPTSPTQRNRQPNPAGLEQLLAGTVQFQAVLQRL